MLWVVLLMTIMAVSDGGSSKPFCLLHCDFMFIFRCSSVSLTLHTAQFLKYHLYINFCFDPFNPRLSFLDCNNTYLASSLFHEVSRAVLWLRALLLVSLKAYFFQQGRSVVE